jgi:hypothetical protein
MTRCEFENRVAIFDKRAIRTVIVLLSLYMILGISVTFAFLKIGVFDLSPNVRFLLFFIGICSLMVVLYPISKWLNRKYGVHCPSCGVLLSGKSKYHILRTGNCRKCSHPILETSRTSAR